MADPTSLSLSDTAATAAAAAGSGARYGLEELLALAGERLGEEISSRTVRLYATEGLIDRPGKHGRHAVYGQRHLLQLLLIRSLARRGLSLTAIAPLVACSDGELIEQLHHLEEPNSPSTRQQEALAYLQSLGADGPGTNRSECSPSLLPLLGAPPSNGTPSLSSRRSLSTRSASRSNAASSRWYRFSLAPGVEVHLSEMASIPPAGSRREAWLQRLLDRLREQLDSES